jgi:hypothetical protein
MATPMHTPQTARVCVNGTHDGSIEPSRPIERNAMSSRDQPEGTDSRVEDWFGQSVERDAELADELSEQLDEGEAQRRFEEQATGESEQAARRGDRIDPDQGRSAYTDTDTDTDSDAGTGTPPAPEQDPDSPGATIDDAEPAEPNEPG